MTTVKECVHAFSVTGVHPHGVFPLGSLPLFVKYGMGQRYVTSARWTAATDGTDEFLTTYQYPVMFFYV